MFETKVIREDEFGVLVLDLTTNNRRLKCQYRKKGVAFCAQTGCDGGRYLTKEEEKEYYSSSRV